MSERAPQRRLTKREVERLTETYDRDPVASLSEALGALTGASGSSWDELIDGLSLPAEMTRQLRARETHALDDLVKQLVEFRCLEQ